MRYLQRVHLEAETAMNGLECTQMVLSKGLDYYSLIIVSTHELSGFYLD